MTYSTNQHAEWLSLIEVSGPFLAEPILNQAFPQGLEKVDPVKKKQFRQTYDEWREVTDSDAQQDIQIKDKIHQQWINWVLKVGLELDEDEDGDTLKNQSQMNDTIQVVVPEHHVTLKPEYVVIGDDETQPYMLVQTYPAGTALSEVLRGDGWSTSPAERMAHLCRGVGTRLGLITNGEQWMFIDAPAGGTTTYASWFARLWGLEPVTLKAFYSLFNIKIVYSGFDDNKTLPQLVDESLTHQGDVTQALGSQVSRAVEVLIQSIDRINHDHNGELLEGVEPEELYEAGLTLMMRLVFLLCAEERGLLLLGDQAYEANYALSTLRAKLREEASLHGDEVLSYRKNAWARLLAIFRSVYAGVEHENMRMPALGGSLFDPDRFPFLEGRIKGSNWLEDEAKPLPIDNRTVLLFLDAIQLYKGRTLSYRALDVEQIGYVYEGLLEQTVKRAPDVTLEFSGSKSCKKPWVYLGELASASLDGEPAVKNLLKERTASSPSRITNDLAKDVTDADVDKLLVACYNDVDLCERIKPYYHFLRFDAWGNPLLYPKHAYMLTSGSDRRETGSHYTPKSLTESLVTETLEPAVYIGPAEGKSREDWQLKSPEELLELKICDPAMGSGAFLVQVCRWLAERVCESWLFAEQSEAFVTMQGVTTTDDSQDLIPIDAEERLIIAKRLISERCLYGVDINPLAVELAKLSIWLVTLSKDRPFGFLDHNLKSGDSLLGIHSLDQLYYLNLNPSQVKNSKLMEQPFSKLIKGLVADTLELRKKISTHDINLVSDIDEMALLEEQAREKILLPKLIADALIGLTLQSGGKLKDISVLSSFVHQSIAGDKESLDALKGIASRGLNTDLPERNKTRKAFHWSLEFPEVFSSLDAGFDVVVGNPPFLGGLKLFTNFGEAYRTFLFDYIAEGVTGTRGAVDLCAFFFLQATKITSTQGCVGFIATNSISQGDTREVALTQISNNFTIYNAIKSFPWPGAANLDVACVHFTKLAWSGLSTLNGKVVSNISSYLDTVEETESQICRLKSNVNIAFQGSNVCGVGFIISPSEAKELFVKNEKYKEVIKPYINGKDINQQLSLLPFRYVIDFENKPLCRENGKFGWANYSNKEKKESLVQGIVPIDYEGAVAQDFSECIAIVANEVKPERKLLKPVNNFNKTLSRLWWQFGGPRFALYKAIKGLDRILVTAAVSGTNSVEWIASDFIFDKQLVCFANDTDSMFTLLQSSIHWIWAKKNGSSMGGTGNLRYTPTSCFQTLPFPEFTNEMEDAGRKLYQLRSDYLTKHKIGLTKFATLFNDPLYNDEDVQNIREQYANSDVTVLAAYGWSDLNLNHNFYEIDELPKRKNIRFSINQEVKGEILYRLASLNKARYEAEQ
jgi:hypothetical protein